MGKESSNTSPHIWSGCFDRWEMACSVGSGFDSGRWQDRIKLQLTDYLEDIAKYGHQAIPPRPSQLPLLVAVSSPRSKAFSIVDFGGSSGWGFHYLMQCAPNCRVDRYDIIELPSVCEIFEDEALCGNGVVNWLSQPDPIGIGIYDIVYVNSVLQYLGSAEAERPFFSLVERSKARYVLIDDFLGVNSPTYYSVQHYYDDRIPVVFRNRNEFISRIENMSYELIMSCPYITTVRGKIEPFPMENMPEDKRVRFGESMLFMATD